MEITAIKKRKKYWNKELFQVIANEENVAFISNAEKIKVSPNETTLVSGEDAIEIDYSSYPGTVTFHGLSKDILIKARVVKGETFKLKQEIKMFGFKWNQHEATWEK